MHGTITIASTLVERGHPDVVRLVHDFVRRGVLLEQRHHGKQQTITYTLDHPDFDVQGGEYGLVVTTHRDPAHDLRHGFRLWKLQRVNSDGTSSTVKEYSP
jgi:hypothetical protein